MRFSHKNKIVLIVSLLLAFILYLRFFIPAQFGRINNLKKWVKEEKETFSNLRSMEREAESLHRMKGRVEFLIEKAENISLAGFIEKEAGNSGIFKYIKSLKPFSGKLDETVLYEGVVVEMSGVNLCDIETFLKKMERAEGLIVNRIFLEKMEGDLNYFNLICGIIKLKRI